MAWAFLGRPRPLLPRGLSGQQGSRASEGRWQQHPMENGRVVVVVLMQRQQGEEEGVERGQEGKTRLRLSSHLFPLPLPLPPAMGHRLLPLPLPLFPLCNSSNILILILPSHRHHLPLLPFTPHLHLRLLQTPLFPPHLLLLSQMHSTYLLLLRHCGLGLDGLNLPVSQAPAAF